MPTETHRPRSPIPLLPRAHLALLERVRRGRSAQFLTVQQIRAIQALEPRLTASARLSARRHRLGPRRLRVLDTAMDLPGRRIALRVWRPEPAPGQADVAPPAVLAVHGGGFAFGSPARLDWAARRLADELGAVVVAPAYRLAPDHPFPAPVDDVEVVLRALCGTGEAELPAVVGPVDPTRVAGFGESAGGLLLALAALRTRTQASRNSGLSARPSAAGQRHPLRAQVLLYPATNLVIERGDEASLPTGPRLSTGDLTRFATMFLAGLGDDGTAHGPVRTDPHLASPLHAPDLSGMPPTLVQTADHDPLEDDALAFADRLLAAGTPVITTRYPGSAHGFLSTPRIAPAAKASVSQAVQFLRRQF